jgi:hypothetical protein
MTALKPRYRKIEASASKRNAMRAADGARKIRYRCRCSKCEHRVTVRGLPWERRKPLVCLCGSQAWRVDWYRMLTETTRTRCDCGGRSFPHRSGSCGMPKYLHGK